jgi:hypothetical protein
LCHWPAPVAVLGRWGLVLVCWNHVGRAAAYSACTFVNVTTARSDRDTQRYDSYLLL